LYVADGPLAYVRSMNVLLRRWWLLPVLFVVTAGSAAVNRAADDGPRGAILLAVASAVVLFAIDRYPWAVAVNGLLVGGYFALAAENGPIFLTVVCATFLIALTLPIRVWLPLVLLNGVLVWAGLVIRGVRTDDPGLAFWQSFGIGAAGAAAAAIATSLRARGEARAERVERAATEERLRMAQDLHDGVGHGLAVIAMQAGVALHVLDRDPAKARASLEAIRDTSRESLEVLRSEIAVMSGSAPRRPAPGLADLPALLDRVRAAGLPVELSGDPGEVTEMTGEVAYVVAQEALTNVLRHADAGRASLSWTRTSDRVLLTVRDDGRGGSVQDEGMGISGMRARVTQVGGSLRAGPATAGGFEVVAELPV
jgi:signal transduction histidine kinase